MSGNKQTIITKEGTRKLKVVREFDAPITHVWDAWTKPELLDQWWAPRPWKAHTQSMDFKEGGKWRYYMQGPEGEKHYCLCDYETINTGKQYKGRDAFCDENGNIMSEPPGMGWEVDFSAKGTATVVTTIITFASEEDMNKIVEMGFKEGFTAAHGNLDELLAKK
jgi:uncharacterized protein YndB with AHSA1/START domain